MINKVFTGINIQHPISGLILNGTKTIETRTYPIPKKYIGVPLLIIETPGKKGDFKARIIGIIQFGNSFRYLNKTEFYKDEKKHKVNASSPWKWTTKGKWGWKITRVEKFKNPIPAPLKKGIIFTSNIEISITS